MDTNHQKNNNKKKTKQKLQVTYLPKNLQYFPWPIRKIQEPLEVIEPPTYLSDPVSPSGNVRSRQTGFLICSREEQTMLISALYPQHLSQYLAHSSCSVNVCWFNNSGNAFRPVLCTSLLESPFPTPLVKTQASPKPCSTLSTSS